MPSVPHVITGSSDDDNSNIVPTVPITGGSDDDNVNIVPGISNTAGQARQGYATSPECCRAAVAKIMADSKEIGEAAAVTAAVLARMRPAAPAASKAVILDGSTDGSIGQAVGEAIEALCDPELPTFDDVVKEFALG